MAAVQTHEARSEVSEPKIARFLFADTRLAWFWLIVRVYVGWQWVQAGFDKIGNVAWTGAKAGTGLGGFLQGALKQVGGAHPNVQGWYGAFLSGFVMHHLTVFSYMVAFGETAVGIALILGVVTGVAAFFGSFMNMNYMLAGSVSVNPVLFVLGLFLVLAWRTAGYYGADYWVLPQLGTPWHPGRAFQHAAVDGDAAHTAA